MRTSSLLLAFAAAALPTVTAAQSHPRNLSAPPQVANSKNQLAAQSDWVGTYTFPEGGGRTAGNTGIFVEHTIKVYRQDERLIADMDAGGFQVSINLRCFAKAEGDTLNLYFERYREDNIPEPYRRKQLLLSLERSTYRGKTRILTYWVAYRPAFRSVKSGRVYFKKSE
jgi:hypothetical protein